MTEEEMLAMEADYKHEVEKYLSMVDGVSPPVRVSRPKSGIAAKAKEMFRVITGPKVARAAFDRRTEICRGCRHVKEVAGNLYCGACGCPHWKIARLSEKLWYARLECPAEKFGQEV